MLVSYPLLFAVLFMWANSYDNNKLWPSFNISEINSIFNDSSSGDKEFKIAYGKNFGNRSTDIDTEDFIDSKSFTDYQNGSVKLKTLKVVNYS